MDTPDQFTFEPICDVHTEDMRKNSIALKQSHPELLVHPSKCALTFKFKDNFSRVKDFEVYPDDTWVITFPKCGTTWTQEMVWLLKNNLDFKTAKEEHLRMRFPFFEMETLISVNKEEEEYPETIEMVAKLKRPRCIKSHLPIQLLPKKLWTVKPKIVYVTRDPRDVAISYYHHHRLWNGYQGKLEDFTDSFLADRVVYSPYWDHVLGFWNLQDKSHVLINNYEEMKQDLAKVIKKTAKFLQVELTENEVNNLRQHLSFSSMKINDSVNYSALCNEIKQKTEIRDDSLVFMRKGESGGWVKTYSPEILEKFKKWNEKNLAGTPYKEYPYPTK